MFDASFGLRTVIVFFFYVLKDVCDIWTFLGLFNVKIRPFFKFLPPLMCFQVTKDNNNLWTIIDKMECLGFISFPSISTFVQIGIFHISSATSNRGGNIWNSNQLVLCFKNWLWVASYPCQIVWVNRYKHLFQ